MSGGGGLCGMEATPRYTMKPKKQTSKGKGRGVCVCEK